MADERDDGGDDRPRVIRPPDTLSKKVGPAGPGGVDPEALERAEQVIAGLSDSYLEWVVEDLAKLETAYRSLRDDPDDKRRIEQVFGIAHDIKGQGGSFGYDLMTVIGNQLCRFIEGREHLSAKDVEVVKVHLDAMKVVISRRMSGDGGREGAQILKGLDLITAKVQGGR